MTCWQVRVTAIARVSVTLGITCSQRHNCNANRISIFLVLIRRTYCLIPALIRRNWEHDGLETKSRVGGGGQGPSPLYSLLM